MSESTSDGSLDLTARIEALLFVAGEPVSLAQLAEVLECSTRQADQALTELSARLQGRGVRLQRNAGQVQMTSAPETAELVERFLGLEATTRLSRAALETLAIIAYQQPVTRPQVDAIRGVNSDGVIKSLLVKGLLQESGRAEGPGRPILYSTTTDFLGHFGLESISELPALQQEANGQEGPAVLKD